MPNKSKKPCAYQGCRELTTNRFCEAHAREAMNRYNKLHRSQDSNKKYGRSWRKIRASYLSKNPLCELCETTGKLIPANMVHHKIKLSDGGTNAQENLQSLCNSCHSRLHAREGDFF
jgi:5-methylcytosine-specific restriction protein A